MFAKGAQEHNPFCGFARLQFEIVNLSDDLVGIEDILIDKQKVERRYGTRIQVIPQGDFKSPLNLIAVVDSNSVDIYENFDKAIRRAPDFFKYGNRIPLEPKERRIINMGIISMHGNWSLTFKIGFAIGKRHGAVTVPYESPTLLYAYVPSSLEHDSNQYAGILGQQDAFADRELFLDFIDNPSEENRGALLRKYESLIVFCY